MELRFNDLKRSGFTLIETLLVVALIAIITGITVSAIGSLTARNELDVSADAVAGALRRAQFLATAVSGDSPWGVKIENNNVIVFKGFGFASRDANFDEIFETAAGMSYSGINEIVFAKFSGKPAQSGSIIIETATDAKTITINNGGAINY